MNARYESRDNNIARARAPREISKLASLNMVAP